MGIKLDLISLDFSQWSKEESYFGSKLAYCKLRFLNGFGTLFGAKTKPIR